MFCQKYDKYAGTVQEIRKYKKSIFFIFLFLLHVCIKQKTKGLHETNGLVKCNSSPVKCAQSKRRAKTLT